VDAPASCLPLVRFQPSGRALRVERGTTLLEAARRAGLPMASACGADGICARCGVRVLAGADRLSPETQAEERQKRRNRIDPALRLACRAAALGDVEVTAGYW
jgi:ferredoxin